MISVVVRAKNEAAWLPRCMQSLRLQAATAPLDIILVDNESTDDSVEISRAFGAKISTITKEDFSFGRALNIGIRLAEYPIVALLSAHCIPKNEMWAHYLAGAFDSTETKNHICGVYGGQDPMPSSLASDIRDLRTTFRNERVYQKEDFFFHNANSAILKEIWYEEPFDEHINGVEDREWGKRLIQKGYTIRYEPKARVYHHHGIHHGRNEERAQRVAEVIEYIHGL